LSFLFEVMYWCLKNNIDIYKEVNFMKNLLNFILGRMKIDEFTIDDYKKTV